METHGWDHMNSRKRVKVPFAEQLAKEIMESGKGLMSDSPKWVMLQHEAGFRYRQFLGEMIFTCITISLNIAYALSLLSRYAAYAKKVHYLGLKRVARYLDETITHRVVHWCKEPLYSHV